MQKEEQLSDFNPPKKKETDVDAMGTGSSKPSAKRRPFPKRDCAPKKQKVSSEPVLGLMAEDTKMVTPAKHGGGKGLMIPPLGSQKKPPVLLREDPKYALEKLSSIISSEDYKDLGNHSTEAMGDGSLLYCLGKCPSSSRPSIFFV